jgi:hypothetical protein
MNDNPLIELFIAQLTAAMAGAGWAYPIVQKNQPTQEGIPTQNAVFFEKLFDNEYGWPGMSGEYVAPTPPVAQGSYNKAEKQWVETTFQVSALAIQDPSNLNVPTASDIVNFVKRYINSRPVIYALKSSGVSILRIGQIRNPYFADDRDLYEANPNFDVILQHNGSLNWSVPATNIVQGQTVEGYTKNGLYPVPDL